MKSAPKIMCSFLAGHLLLAKEMDREMFLSLLLLLLLMALDRKRKQRGNKLPRSSSQSASKALPLLNARSLACELPQTVEANRFALAHRRATANRLIAVRLRCDLQCRLSRLSFTQTTMFRPMKSCGRPSLTGHLLLLRRIIITMRHNNNN